MSKIVVYKEKEPGVFFAYRNTGEEPFAKFLSPKKNGTRKWQVFYRDAKQDDPFIGEPNVSPKTMKDVIAELTWSLNNCNDYQLGLTTEIPNN